MTSDVVPGYLMSPEWADLTRRMHGACVQQVAFEGFGWTISDEVTGAHSLARWIRSPGILSSLKRIRRVTHVEGGGQADTALSDNVITRIARFLLETKAAAQVRGTRRFSARLFMPTDEIQDAIIEAVSGVGLPVSCVHTYVLALAGGEDAVLAGFDRSVRKNLRKAERQGIQVLAATSNEHFDDYYTVMAESRQALGLRMFPRRFWDLHREHLTINARASFYVAYFEGTPLACLGAGWGDVWVTEVLSGTSHAARVGSHFAGEALKWRIIRDAIQRQVPYYDLAGVRLEAASPKEEAILKYKRKFGGQLTRIALVDLPVRSSDPRSSGEGS